MRGRGLYEGGGGAYTWSTQSAKETVGLPLYKGGGGGGGGVGEVRYLKKMSVGKMPNFKRPPKILS